jgi:multiple sugar transport system substrate-binding protein
VTPAEPLRVALVGGPMYDHLYRGFAPGTVEVVVHADHPTLNRRVAELLGRGERIDVLATHSKYAPSQARWLQPMDSLLDPASVTELAPRAVELCRFEGAQLCVPRLIDVRILWYWRGRVDAVPDSWDALVASGLRFGFPGRESGLFGTFFELVVGDGGDLFDAGGRATIVGAAAENAIETLRALASRAPGDLPDWHYDDVDRALLDGRVDAAGVWPGGYGAIRDRAGGGLAPAPYPAGPVRRVSYSGCHAWAIPTTCADVPRAVEFVNRLIGADAQARDAAGGSMCAHRDALASVRPADPIDAARLEITRATIADAMITYPPHPRFPELEDAGWTALRGAIRGEITARRALTSMQAVAERVLTAARGVHGP